MTEQEHIEEMVGVMAASNNPFVDIPIEIMPKVTKALYNADHRKADEVRKDTAKEILTELLDFVNGWFEGTGNNDFGVEFNRISKDFAEKYGIEVKE